MGGVLYPPQSLPNQAFDEIKIKESCLYQDDIWLKAWSTINGFTNVIVTEKIPLDVMGELQEDCLHVMNKYTGNADAFYKVGHFLNEIYYKGVLEDKLFYSGKSTEEYWNQACIDQSDIFSDIEHILKNGKLYVYGAGKNAALISELLKKLDIRPYRYLVLDPKMNPSMFTGVKVVGIDEEKPPTEEYRIIISPEGKHHKKILQDLQDRGWKNFLFSTDEWMGELLKGTNKIDMATRNIILDYLKLEHANSLE